MTERQSFTALGSLEPFFQPVFALRGDRLNLHHFTCFVRGPAPSLLPVSKSEGGHGDRSSALLDKVAISIILQAAQPLTTTAPIALRVQAETLEEEPSFGQFLNDLCQIWGLDCRRLIVELANPRMDSPGARLLAGIMALRRLGVRLALDDVGLAGANLDLMLDAGAELWKVARHFIRGCHRDPHRRAVLNSLQELGSQLGAALVAKGVDDGADLALLRELGIPFAQGHHLAPPRSAAEAGRWGALVG